MGSANCGRMLVGIVLLGGFVAVSPGTSGCKSSKNKVSSESFVAPQPIAVDPTTGLNSQGQRAVDVAVSKLEILREVFRDKETGLVTKLDSELRSTSARILPVGKLDKDRLLIFEELSKTMLTVDFSTNAVVKNWDREQVLALFRGQAQKPLMAPVLQLSNGWLFGYESTSKSLFSIKADATNPDGIIGSLVMDQNEMQEQAFPPDCTMIKTQVTIKSMLEFEPGHILIVPVNPNLTTLLHVEVEDLTTSLEARFVVEDCEPFLDYKTKIKPVTGNIDVDVKDFPPVKIPGTDQVILFDRAKDTSSYLVVHIRNVGGVYSTFVEIGADRNDLLNALEDVNKGGEPFAGQFKFSSSFLHARATLPPTDPRYTPLVLAYNDETNNMFAFDFVLPRGAAGKVSIFTSSTQLSGRTDLNFDPAIDGGTFDPQLFFSGNNVVDNKLAFDNGSSQLASFSYDVGQVVVVLHKRDVTAVTGAGLLQLNHIETLDPPPDGKGMNLRMMDLESSSIIAVRLEYVPVPVSYPRGF